MLFLNPVYHNTIGTTYLIKNSLEEALHSQKIQLLIGDTALIIEQKDITKLLEVIKSAKKSCTCKDCESKKIPKKIKCKTDYFNLVFKSTENNIDALEELLQGTIFELQIDAILDFYDID